MLQSIYYRRNFRKEAFLIGQCSLLGFLWERKLRDNFTGKFHWTVQMIQQHCKSFNMVKTHSTLQVEIIQDSTNHSTLHKSFNVVKIHSTSQLQIIHRCTNHSMFWKSENNRAGLINFKVQWKTHIVDTIEIGQNCPLYITTGYLWTETPYFDLYI